MNKKYILIISLIAVVILLYTQNFFKKAEKPLIVGMMNGWVPYMHINNNGQMEGFDVDIVKEIEKITKKNIIIKDLGSLSSLFIALEQNTVDAILSGLDVTQKRKESYDFILYGGDKTKLTQFYCITKKNGPKNENDLINNSYNIGLESALSWESTLNKYENINKIYTSSTAEMLLQLQQDKIDAFFIDPVNVNRLIKNTPELNYFAIDIDESVKIDGIGIFIKKGNTDIKELLENAVKQLTEKNIIDFLINKWQLI